jgi:hypothetical protein
MFASFRSILGRKSRGGSSGFASPRRSPLFSRLFEVKRIPARGHICGDGAVSIHSGHAGRPVLRAGTTYRPWCRDAECSLASRNGRTDTKRHHIRGKALASRSGSSAGIHAIALGAGPCAPKDLEANGGHNGHYRSPAAGPPNCRAIPRNISRPIGFVPACRSQYAHGCPWPVGTRRNDSSAARPPRRTPSAVPTHCQRQTSRCYDEGNRRVCDPYGARASREHRVGRCEKRLAQIDREP